MSGSVSGAVSSDVERFSRAMQPLIVGFAGEVREVCPPDALSFGRLADLVLDDNPYMHRVVGRFVFRNGLWWLQNVGSRIELDIADRASGSLHSVKTSAESPLHVAEALVRFSAGRSTYELEVTVEPVDAASVAVLDEVNGAETITMSGLPMTPGQLRLILSLAEPALLDPLAREIRIPANRQAAQRLGWTLTRFNRKLDNVCQKLAKQGVPGLHGDMGELAVDRRRRLVEYAIRSGMVKPEDLPILDRPEEP